MSSEVAKEITKARILNRIAQRSAYQERQIGDRDLNPDFVPPDGRQKKAAVLVGLVDHPTGFSVLLTQRTDHLRDHAGQISFPGGKIEAHDGTPIRTALRETEEEVGVPPDLVEVIGRLDRYTTGTGFEIVPVVGFIRPGYPVEPDPFEVAEVFEVPLSHFLNLDNHRRETRKIRGQERSFYAMPYGRYYIWGATAGMLVNLAEILLSE